jgi:hypothetical protein
VRVCVVCVWMEGWDVLSLEHRALLDWSTLYGSFLQTYPVPKTCGLATARCHQPLIFVLWLCVSWLLFPE